MEDHRALEKYVRHWFDWGYLKSNEKYGIQMLRAAARAGSTEAVYGLAERYRLGMGVETNPKESFRLLQISTCRDHIYSIRRVLKCLIEGIGVMKSEAEALSFARQFTYGGTGIFFFAWGCQH